jgi:hypothetical protein
MDSFYMLKWLLFIGVIVGIVFLVLALTKNKSDPSTSSANEEAKTKGVMVDCKSNFDCGPGLFCEMRTHPTVGICVVAPGGACHGLGGGNEVCYSGYYCDSQDGTCLKA